MFSLLKKLWRPELQTWLKIWLTVMGLLFLSRFFFYFTHRDFFSSSTCTEIFQAFLKGFRFDLSTALITISLPVVLFLLPWPKLLRGFFCKFSAILTAIVVILMVSFLWGDILFFRENGRHLTIEPLGVLKDISPMLKLILTQYPIQLILAIAVFIGIAKLIFRLYRPLLKVEHSYSPWWSSPIILLAITAFTVIGIRGGLQKSPLRTSDAVFMGNPTLGNLSLNGWYSFLTTVNHQSRAGKLYMPEQAAFQITQKLIAIKNEQFESPEYPLLRKFTPSFSIVTENEKLNVVLIVVESLNATYLKTFGGELSVMPFLDSLAEQSVIFTNCHAIGTRSFRGLCAVLASYPNLVGDPYAITTTLPRLRGMGDLFKEQGYHVRFLHGAAPGSMGIEAICRMAGYSDFISSDDFPKSNFNGSWGIWDHVALESMSKDMDLISEPIHYGLFTLCTHAPWKLPSNYKPIFDSGTPDAEILNTFNYLDESLRSFFIRESKQERFTRTLYMIIGDHTSHASEEERFRIGCLLYAPSRLNHKVETKMVSQLDILPTALDLAGIETLRSGFGKSMFDTTSQRNVMITTQSNSLYYLSDRRVFVSDMEKDIGLYDPISDPASKNNLLATETQVAESLRQEFYGYYQTASELMLKNKIFPSLNH